LRSNTSKTLPRYDRKIDDEDEEEYDDENETLNRYETLG
jgi:hypothetical protein